ncbi:response regulator transcription factor [Dehalococcoides mccartyi]|uniref:response regulator n=1 Tax=Dehalococcoides mccartyi TaxID=61435 RepID=UPI0003C8925C|nr:response regulator transcription factor [Dehalococcoides mccartyi]AHB12913.1 LuxR family DNA-binding response regulator [Dehalococcoides mccartyi GY50]
MIRILIADDHPIVRAGVKQILEKKNCLYTLDEAQDAYEAKSKIVQVVYDVILLDLTMPGTRGFDTLKEIKALRPQTPVLVLSIHPEEQFGLRALKAGASGFVSKESAPRDLITAINRVSKGGKYLSAALTEKIADSINEQEGLSHTKLSDREFDIFIQLARGESIQNIAKTFNLSAKTVYTHRERLMDKMKLTSTAQIIKYAIENNLV